MGFLRFYLAICVVAAHSGAALPVSMHDGRQAVQIFYLISGFYMQLILSSGKYQRTIDFYKSRGMRILFPYWIAFALIVGISIPHGYILGDFLSLESWFSDPLSHNGVLGLILAGITNVTVFGQDWIMFLTQDVGEPLRATSNFAASDWPLYRYLSIPQCWTVGVELTFYLLVPMLGRLKTPTLTLVAVISMVGRLYTYRVLELTNDPWDYRFFPFELALFATGMLACRVWRRPDVQRYLTRLTLPASSAGYLLYCLLAGALYLMIAGLTIRYPISRLGGHYGSLAVYPLWAVALIPLFQASRHHSFDRWIGELSFPIYLLHYFVVAVALAFLSRNGIDASWLSYLAITASVLLAILFNSVFMAPIERRRRKLAGRGKEAA